MTIDSEFWARRRVLVTGHTGFKGAWLSLWLQSLGAEVSGLAGGPPTRPSLYELAEVGSGMREHILDVRDGAAVTEALLAARPEIIVHMAAQPLVRRSLADPARTYAVNVLGTVNVLEAIRLAGLDVRAAVVVTSDKVYDNPRDSPLRRRFVEQDRLGGDDPYSSSKACAELVTAAYRSSYFHDEDGPQLATARAGNVIGGGDWGEDRLLGDAMRAVASGEPLRVRNPGAVRPWQHVFNALSGYLLLAERLWQRGKVGGEAARAWNFGPSPADERTVGWVVERLNALLGGELRWESEEAPQPPEALHLALDSSAAERELSWRPAWSLEEALGRVVEWHAAQRTGGDVRGLSLAQIAAYG